MGAVRLRPGLHHRVKPRPQLDALAAAGVEPANCHLDHASGAKASRPQLDLLLHRLRDGDTLVVTRLDRLGRSVVHLITLGAQLREREVGLRVLEQGIDTATAEGGCPSPGRAGGSSVVIVHPARNCTRARL